MPNVWPVTLPPLNQSSSYTEDPADRAIRTDMDAGPAKVRQNPNAPADTISFEQIHTTTQTSDLDTFYVTTLKGGSLTFDDTHPRTGVTVTYRFVGPPRYQHMGGPLYTTRIDLEVLP